MANIIYAFVNNTIVADQEYEFYLCFDSLLDGDESQLLRCHLYDPQFFLEYYLPEIPISSMQKVNSINSLLVSKTTAVTVGKNIRSFKIKFPTHLAGGTFKLDFILQGGGVNSLESAYKIYDIQSVNDFIAKVSSSNLQSPTGMTVYNNQISVDVTIEHPSGPSFKDLYWGENEDIKYEKTSSPRSKTTVYSNEQLYAHIHTEGMYGKQIKVDIGKYTNIPVTIKDNTLVIDYAADTFYNTSQNTFLFRPYTTNISCGKAITPNLTYNSGKALNIGAPTTSSANVMTEAKTDDWEKCSDSLCRVDFRPTKKYDGSFGFSWFRVDDTNDHYFLNDRSFLENLGYHYETYNAGENGSKIVDQDPNNYEGDFYKDDEMIKKHINDYQRIIMPLMLDGDDIESPESVLSGKYLVPQMTIRKGETAELEMYIKSKSMPQKFSFEYSDPAAEKFITIDKKELDSIKKGDTIKIECKKEFSKAVNLNIYAYPQKDDEKTRDLCGSIRILPNDIMHQRNVDVLILNVCLLSDDNSTTLDGGEITQIEEKDLEKFYGQSYINIHLHKEKVELYNQEDPYVKSYYQDIGILPIDEFNDLLIDDSSAHSKDLDYDYGSDLAEFMDKLIQYIPGISRYCYKIILIPWVMTEKVIENGIEEYSELNGFSIDEERLTFCFVGCEKSTPTHELGHAFGLPHTFTGCTSKAKYVYQYTMTDNFMDYSHHIGIDRQSFYYWQWKTMNALME